MRSTDVGSTGGPTKQPTSGAKSNCEGEKWEKGNWDEGNWDKGDWGTN